MSHPHSYHHAHLSRHPRLQPCITRTLRRVVGESRYACCAHTRRSASLSQAILVRPTRDRISTLVMVVDLERRDLASAATQERTCLSTNLDFARFAVAGLYASTGNRHSRTSA